MRKVLVNLASATILFSGLTACSFMHSAPQPNTTTGVNANPVEEKPIELSGAPVADTGPLAGSIQSAMDTQDQTRLSKALDGGIGKATHWVSRSTGIAYTVVPTQKISVYGNGLCRKYSITATRGGNTQQMNGSACIGSDGAWHSAVSIR